MKLLEKGETKILKNKECTQIYSLNYLNNNKVYIKRDDLIPFSFGGNKVRIAQEYFTDMKKRDCDCIISYGNSKSNLNRVIANMSKSLNIHCYIISPVEEPKETMDTLNSRIVKLMGAEIIKCSKKNVTATVERVINQCEAKGYKPYYINGDKYGKGNEKVAVDAYVKVYDEILKYEKDNEIMFDYIFHASGTGLTQAGLIAGKIKNNDNKKIVGISIARNKEIGKSAIRRNLKAYYSNICSDRLNNEIEFEDKYISDGYGKYNNEIVKVVKNILSTDGIPLDYTYTGKAFWGMLKYIKENNIIKNNILFIHTGGTPLFFDDLNFD